jgi:hypothetical protein
MSEAELEAALFSADVKPPRALARNLLDFSHIHKEPQENKHVTLQLLWEESWSDASRRLSLQSVLPPLPAIETPAGRSDAPATSPRREAVCRLALF